MEGNPSLKLVPGPPVLSGDAVETTALEHERGPSK